MSGAALYIGTSGWSYPWSSFYPEGLPSRDYLHYYSLTFRAVEVNYSFYHLPRPATYDAWARSTPADFVFAVKLSRYITHIKKLSRVGESLKKFLANASSLGPKLGPVLVQLPPSMRFDCERLESFLEEVHETERVIENIASLRVAFEFRHSSWFESPAIERTAGVLAKHEAAFVFAHSSRYPYPESEPLTTDFVYLRFHGPGRMFASRYGKKSLSRWVPSIRKWLREGRKVHAYFNNDVEGYAVSDALDLKEALARKT